MFGGLDLAARARLFNCSERNYVELASEIAAFDPRILAAAALQPRAVRRLRAWLEADRPIAAPAEVYFHGHDSVRAILVATLADVPAPVRWHAVQHIVWFEVGRGARGFAVTFSPRALASDASQAIVLDGRCADAAMPALICHELAHAWEGPSRAANVSKAGEHQLTDHEFLAAFLDGFEGDREQASRSLFERELIADECARLWGHPPDAHFLTGMRRLQHFRELFNTTTVEPDQRTPDVAESAAAAAIERIGP